MEKIFECVIFVGIQGSGKSTFYKENFFKTHIRINLDMLKTRNREKILTNACFEAKQNMVIDNTNPTAENRACYINAAKKAGFKVTVYYFDTEFQTAKERNNRRNGREKVPEAALAYTKKLMKKPEFIEGIDEIYIVSVQDNAVCVKKQENTEI